MASLNMRLRALEHGQAAPHCPDRWHQPLGALAVRTVDYRHHVAPLAPGYREPTTEPPEPERCRTCGEERLRITVRAIDVPSGVSLGFGRRLTPHPDDSSSAPGAVLPGARA